MGFWTALAQQDTQYMQRWLLRGMASYFLPIFFILLFRYIAWRISNERIRTSLVTYAWIMIGALVISTISGNAVSLFLGSELSISELTWRNAPWSIGPALTALYINYYLDCQSDPVKDDIVQSRNTIVSRLVSAFGFTIMLVVLSLLIVGHQQMSSNSWPREETRVIVVGTVALITFCLCLVAQFGLHKHLIRDD